MDLTREKTSDMYYVVNKHVECTRPGFNTLDQASETVLFRANQVVAFMQPLW